MQDMKQIFVRIPADMKEWLLDQAARNASSLNSEVIRCVRERMDREARPQT